MTLRSRQKKTTTILTWKNKPINKLNYKDVLLLTTSKDEPVERGKGGDNVELYFNES